MKKNTSPQFTSLRDLYLSSFLKAKAFPLDDATIDEQGRTIFHFQETPDLTIALKGYYSGTALVNPSTFIEAFKSLRSLAYQLSGDLKKNVNENGDKYGQSNQSRQEGNS